MAVKPNERTLEELINGVSEDQKEKAIEKYVELLATVAHNLYSSYQVLRQDPQTKEQRLHGHSLFFQSHIADPITKDEHQEMFRLAFDNNLNIYELNKAFRAKAESGEVLPLGDVVIADTALGNILDGSELPFTITFMLTEDFEEKERKMKEADEKINEKLNGGDKDGE